MKKIVVTFFGILLLFSTYSCTDDSSDVVEANNDLRIKLTSGKTQNQIKIDYAKLSKKEQISVWVSKIDQVLEQNLPEKQKLLIIELRNKLKLSYSVDNGEDIKLLAASIAESSSGQDFIQMFENLNDYKYSGYSAPDKLSLAIASDIQNFQNTDMPKQDNPYSKKPSCNCRWTCAFYGGGSDNCEQTDGGCGFLWMQDCTEVV